MNENYLTYANLTRELINNMYTMNYKHNDISYMSQNTCERYMKHIIEEYFTPTNDEERMSKTNILRSHNLNSLQNYISEKLNCRYSEETSLLIDSINGFYYTTRYPGESSMLANENDIDRCYKAVNKCYEETVEIINNLEQQINTYNENQQDVLDEIIQIVSDDDASL